MWSLAKKPRQPARPCLGPPLPSWHWRPGAWQAQSAGRLGGGRWDQRPGAACQAPLAPLTQALRRERRAPPPVHPHQTPKI